MTPTLKGGATLTVLLENETMQELHIRQLRVRDYDDAFPVYDNEIRLLALACDKPEDFIKELTPESFDSAVAHLNEINKGFFGYAQRQMDKLTKRLNGMAPHVIAAAKAKADEKHLNNSVDGLRPR